MKFREKVIWLQKHYGDYSTAWYNENEARTSRIFKREYGKFVKEQNTKTINIQQQEMQDKLDIMKSVYFEVYQVDYDQDFRNNRQETLRKSRDISSQWVNRIG